MKLTMTVDISFRSYEDGKENDISKAEFEYKEIFESQLRMYQRGLLSLNDVLNKMEMARTEIESKYEVVSYKDSRKIKFCGQEYKKP